MGVHKDASWEDVKIAKELCYPESVIHALKAEKDEAKRQNILHDARKGIFPSVGDESKEILETNRVVYLRERLKEHLMETGHAVFYIANEMGLSNGTDLFAWLYGVHRFSERSLDKIEKYLKGKGAL